MSKRTESRVLFTYGLATALVATAIVLYSLMAGWSREQTLILLVGTLIVVWTIIFSFLEVRRIAARKKSILGPDDVVDPDAAREVIVHGPTAEATPHHEAHIGSPGLDQGQLTARLPDQTPSLGNLLHRGQHKEPETRR